MESTTLPRRTLLPLLPLLPLLAALTLTGSEAAAQVPGEVASVRQLLHVQGDSTQAIGDRFGSAVAPLGDLDGDGVLDVAIGAQSDDAPFFGSGGIWIAFLNQDGSIKASQKIDALQGGFSGPSQQSDLFGRALEPLGDLDGDGIVDLAVGSDHPGNSSPSRIGALFILFLNADGTVKADQMITEGVGGFTGDLDPYDFFSLDVANLGDLDGDGVTDVAVGAGLDDDGGTNYGAVYVLFLRIDGTVKSHTKISQTSGGFTGTLSDDDRFGHGLAALGDLDGDGIGDLAVAANVDTFCNHEAAVYVLFLRADGTVKSHVRIAEGEGGFGGTLGLDCFGSDLACLGDLDGDGSPELLVGAEDDDGLGQDRGGLWILFLRPDGTVRFELEIAEMQGGFRAPLDDFDGFGTAVAPIGDLDGNGFVDLVIGAPDDDDAIVTNSDQCVFSDPELCDAGAAWILFLDEGAQAERVLRNGSGINRLCFASADVPKLGTAWGATVDASGHPGATFSILHARDLPSAGIVIPAGELLVDVLSGTLLFEVVRASTGGTDRFAIPVPDEIALFGLPLSIQAALVGGGVELCNAFDLVLGR